MPVLNSELSISLRAARWPRALLGRRLRGDEGGQSLVEFALVLPLLLLLMLGIFKFGVAFTNYLTLTDAARNGARELAVERGQANPCAAAATAAKNAAGSLAGITVTEQFPAPDVSTCANLVSGEDAVVTTTYPCDLSIMGIDFAPGCTLSASATERIE
jgi:Flp pilus assembly protein TadG